MNSKSVAESYRQLKEKAAQGYWAQRILAETGYLIELLYRKGVDTGLLIEEAVGRRQNGRSSSCSRCLKGIRSTRCSVRPMPILI